MREIGVRELKARLSEALRDVERGEPLRVTSRGRPVADILPATPRRADDRLRALAVEGRIVLPSRARPTRPPRLAKGTRSASALVLGERADER